MHTPTNGRVWKNSYKFIYMTFTFYKYITAPPYIHKNTVNDDDDNVISLMVYTACFAHTFTIVSISLLKFSVWGKCL